MFFGRYSTLRTWSSGRKFVYPCYQLGVQYRESCWFHSSFGGLADICDAEYWGVIEFSTSLVHGKLFESYGGMLGVAVGFCFVYFPFVNNLPLTQAQKARSGTWIKSFSTFNHFMNIPNSWAVSLTVINP